LSDDLAVQLSRSGPLTELTPRELETLIQDGDWQNFPSFLEQYPIYLVRKRCQRRRSDIRMSGG
jgi:hypothetical protein